MKRIQNARMGADVISGQSLELTSQRCQNTDDHLLVHVAYTAGNPESFRIRGRHAVFLLVDRTLRACPFFESISTIGINLGQFSLMHNTSPTLLERLRQGGDPAAWQRFVTLYTPLLYYWSRRHGLQSTDADELLQEVFRTLLIKLPRFQYDPQSSFRSWLRTVTTHTLQAQRRRRMERPVGGDGVGWDEIAAAESSESLGEAEYREYIAARALDLIQAEFASSTWRTFWETTVQDRPVSDVAAEFGMTPNAVHIARCRVIRRLREELRGLLDD